jgi:hypothetical protein
MKLSKGKKITVAAVGVFVLLGATASTVYAVSNTDTGDHFSLPAGTVVTGNLKAGTDFTANGIIDGGSIIVTCTTFSTTGTVPASGLKIKIAPPTISGCTDSLGGTDTVNTNQTNGKWSLKELDVAGTGDNSEPNTGDKAKLTIPKAGATFQSSIFGSACVIVVEPTAAGSVKGTYDDVNTMTFSKVSFATAPSASSVCTAGSTATSSATEVLNKNVHDT